MFKKILLSLSLFFVISFAQQPAKSIYLNKTVFEEKMVWDNILGNVRKMIPATKIQKGTTLIYVNEIINQSKVNKKRVVIENPIPYGTEYIRGSSRCVGVCEMLYSIDGGKTFKDSSELFVIYGSRKRVARGSEYTHIKYTFPKLAPFEKTRMTFKARVK